MATLNGTDAAEVLTGTAVADLINGLGGADTITGGGGADTIAAGDGDDLILGPGGAFGGPGGVIDGGAGVDTLDLSGYQIPTGLTQLYQVATGTGVVNLSFFSRFIPPPSTGPITLTPLGTVTGVEIFNFGPGNDSLDFSGVGSVTISGGAGGDRITGGSQASVIQGDAGNDSIVGGGGADRLEGGAGNDTLTGGGGNDTLLGGEGDDRIVYGSGVQVDGGAGFDSWDFSGYNSSAFFFNTPLTIRSGATAGTFAVDTFIFERGGPGYTLTATGFEGFERLILGQGTSVSLADATRDLSIVSTVSLGENIKTGSGSDSVLIGRTNNSVAVGYNIDGGGGTDTLSLSGASTDYFFQRTAAGWSIYEGRAGVHTVANVEQVQFGTGPALTFEQAAANDFDSLAYLARYADLRAAFGTDFIKAFQHFQTTGAAQGRINKPFDALTYIASGGDLIRAFGTDTAAATAHFEQYYALYPRPFDSFNGLTYIASNPDLMARFGTDGVAGTRHYIETGFFEGRATATFNPLIYAASSPDLARAFGADADAAARHFITWSPQKTHPVSGFEPLVYLASNLQLVATLGINADAALKHYLTIGVLGGAPTASFDPLNYSASSLDLALAFGTNREAATLHYLTYGPQGTHPASGFDAVAYLLTYGELAGKTPAEAQLHWLQTGARAGLVGDSAFGRDQTSHLFAFNASSVADSFHVASDRDWFSVYATTTQTFSFNGSAGVASMALYDSLGRLIASDADGRDFRVAMTTGTQYYLVATGSAVAEYTIARTPLGQGAAQDDTSPISLTTWMGDPTGLV